MKSILGLFLFLLGIAKVPFNLKPNPFPKVLSSTVTPTSTPTPTTKPPTSTPTSTPTPTTKPPTSTPLPTETPVPDIPVDLGVPPDTGDSDTSGDNQPADESANQKPQSNPSPTPTTKITPTKKKINVKEQENANQELEKQIEKPNVENVQLSNDHGLNVEIKTIRAKNLQKAKTNGIPSSVTVNLDKNGKGEVVSVQTSNSGLKLTSASVSALIKSPLFIDRTNHNVSVINPDKSKTVIVLPDQVANTAKGKTLLTKISKLELNDQAKYEIHGEGTAKVFGLFTVKVPMTALIDGRTGKLLSSQVAGSYGLFGSVMRK